MLHHFGYYDRIQVSADKIIRGNLYFDASYWQILKMTAKALPRLDDDDRLRPLLTHMSRNNVSQEYDATSQATLKGQITNSDIDRVLKQYGTFFNI